MRRIKFRQVAATTLLALTLTLTLTLTTATTATVNVGKTDIPTRQVIQTAPVAAKLVAKPLTVKDQARAVLAAQGLDATQFKCFSSIVSRESGWNSRATNASSGAYGLMQALPASKMASAGADYRTNPATQIKWGLSYMKDRYGSPCGASAFWQTHRWY